jgi:hypothetical protein
MLGSDTLHNPLLLRGPTHLRRKRTKLCADLTIPIDIINGFTTMGHGGFIGCTVNGVHGASTNKW